MSSIFQISVHEAEGGPVKFNAGTGPTSPAYSTGGLKYDVAGAIYATTADAISYTQQGIPFDANGRVCIATSGTVDRIAPGAIPFTSAGRVLIAGASSTVNHGVVHAATGALAAA